MHQNSIDHTKEVEKRISAIKASPRDICSFYQPRDRCLVAMKECWYCRYADFRLDELKPLEVGTCCFPKL